MAAIDMLVTSGNGPVECRIALMALVEIIEKEADRLGCAVEVTFGHRPDRHGAKSAVLSLEGRNAEALAQDYCGTVKFVFKSPVRPGHKRQNWFVGVQVVDLADAATVSIAPSDVRFETLRAGGLADSTRTPPTAPCGPFTCQPALSSPPATNARSTATRSSRCAGWKRCCVSLPSVRLKCRRRRCSWPTRPWNAATRSRCSTSDVAAASSSDGGAPRSEIYYREDCKPRESCPAPNACLT